jgi:hypothetical protein
MRSLLLPLVVVLAIAAASDAGAQNYPGRGGGRRGSDTSKGDSDQRHQAPAVQPEPYGALERELPSLKIDLLIRAEQLDAWRVFERDVRDIAEMERSRRRHLMALKDSFGEKPPTALTFINSLVEDDRVKSEASAELKRHLDQLYGLLDDAQRRTFDRRIIQSQTEPLGTNSP